MFHCCWLHGWLIGSICCGRMRRVTLLTGRISFQLFLREQASQPHPSQQAWSQKHWKACPHLVVWTSDADVGGQNSMLRWSQWLFNWDSAMWSGGRLIQALKSRQVNENMHWYAVKLTKTGNQVQKLIETCTSSIFISVKYAAKYISKNISIM